MFECLGFQSGAVEVFFFWDVVVCHAIIGANHPVTQTHIPEGVMCRISLPSVWDVTLIHTGSHMPGLPSKVSFV